MGPIIIILSIPCGVASFTKNLQAWLVAPKVQSNSTHVVALPFYRTCLSDYQSQPSKGHITKSSPMQFPFLQGIFPKLLTHVYHIFHHTCYQGTKFCPIFHTLLMSILDKTKFISRRYIFYYSLFIFSHTLQGGSTPILLYNSHLSTSFYQLNQGSYASPLPFPVLWVDGLPFCLSDIARWFDSTVLALQMFSVLKEKCSIFKSNLIHTLLPHITDSESLLYPTKGFGSLIVSVLVNIKRHKINTCTIKIIDHSHLTTATIQLTTSGLSLNLPPPSVPNAQKVQYR